MVDHLHDFARSSPQDAGAVWRIATFLARVGAVPHDHEMPAEGSTVREAATDA
jgi:hypothetical protein